MVRHPEFLMLATAAAINFCSLAWFIGSAPAIVEKHWHLGATSYWMLFLPVISGILLGAIVSARTVGQYDLVKQVRIGFSITFATVFARVVIHLIVGDPPVPVRQALLFVGASGAQFAFPALTLRMLDLFPAARGTAASSQSFVALLVTAFTLGIVAPIVLSHLEWIAWTSLACNGLAWLCWYLSRTYHNRSIAAA